ncbi:MAG: nuclear transport factor 2 family protein [Phaeodactylibacter sp.]|nr:nuclear transport factor 2 family protein [Phaeodactylibacter sp.]MCB9050367.1 nuclear transport factor 2 family protein [Lewinellaceae bacterium]
MLRIAIITALLIASSSIAFGQKKASASSDEAAIKEVIEQESRTFWARDFKSWEKLWVHEPYTIWTAASNTGVRQYNGWNAWKEQVENLFAESPEAIPYDGDVKKHNFSFRIYGNGAWVTFEQDNKGTITYETRIMEKHGGKWKIAAVQLFFNTNEPEGAPVNVQGFNE